MTVTVYGASDDLLEVDGDIREEFGCYNIESGIVAFGDGTALRVKYDGCWRFTVVARGSATLTKVEAEGEDAINYSDRVTLDGDVRWVVFSKHGNIAKAAP